MSFLVASYNVLADAYVRRPYYPLTPAELFAPERRRAAVAERVAGLNADLNCLQEVEPAMLAAIAARLPGHRACSEPKHGKADAVATLTRLPVLERHAVAHHDGTGHVSLLVIVEADGRRLGIASSHVKWDAPGAQVGLAQVKALLARVERHPCEGWILAGDFNADPSSPLAALVRAGGWRDAYAAHDEAFTCNSSQVPKRIDFLFHSDSLVAQPGALPVITPGTPLPSVLEPSDHLPIIARFTWHAQGG